MERNELLESVKNFRVYVKVKGLTKKGRLSIIDVYEIVSDIENAFDLSKIDSIGKCDIHNNLKGFDVYYNNFRLNEKEIKYDNFNSICGIINIPIYIMKKNKINDVTIIQKFIYRRICVVEFE